ncbi:MAG: TetR/AcrR family transcriptional regulator [Actinomycetota bacterium]
MPRSTPRLSRDDWARAGLEALASGGIAAVKVEVIAKRLGTTKGSFYWHFDGRRDLVEAALERWEGDHTEAVIRAMDEEPDPRARLERLFRTIVEATYSDRVELALLTAADDPDVRGAVERVSRRRVSYMARMLRELGMSGDEADQRSLLVYAAYLGHLQLAASTTLLPEPGSSRWTAHVDHLVTALLQPVMDAPARG